MMSLLQLLDLKHPLLKKIPIVEYVKGYFEDGHPFIEGAIKLEGELNERK